MNEAPFVSVVIPCRNEERFLTTCLDSVLAQDYPSERMEVLIAEGMSSDRTRLILEDYSRRHATIRWFENPAMTTAAGLNLLIGKSIGEIVVRLDAHSYFPREYLSRCVRYLEECKVDNVGGVAKALPGAETRIAQAIALALASRFGVGNSAFRVGVGVPTVVDTVPFGCYRKETFSRIGLFNENLLRCEDNEFNRRLAKAGGKILLHPEIRSSYFARPDIPSVIEQHFQNGFGVIYSTRFAEHSFSLRHLIPGICMIAFLASMVLGTWLPSLLWAGSVAVAFYGLGVFTASGLLALKNGLRYFPYLLIVFPALHVSYGVGSLWAVSRLLARRR